MKKIISAIMACILVSGTAFSAHAIDFRNLSQEVMSASYDNSQLAEYAEQVAVLVNKERNAYGLQPVKVSPKLSEAANIRASELKENFSHTRPNGTSCFTAMSELEIQYRAAAENIAYGQKNPESVMNAWMNSSGHRANILNEKMEYIGVGVVYRDGVYYWSQFFAASNNLSNDAYLPGENENIVPPLVTTTTQVTATAKTITTDQISTTSAKPIAVTTNKPATTVLTTTDINTTTKVTTSTQPLSTEQTTTTTKCTETTPCISNYLNSFSLLEKLYAIGKNAQFIIYHNCFFK
ncbi:MAG: CAP domain-containing protein [Ruminococcus flavefaciens]|nr:CAP domain-containing protein [Ruminococcus flavefaciens]MCM1062194.1 CAP domain-containing protein [Eubacterium sp.]